MNTDHHQSMHVVPTVAAAARENLQRIVDNGIANTSRVIERVMGEVPTDYVVHGARLQFDVEPTGRLSLGYPTPQGGEQFSHAHDHAFGQVVDRSEIPRAYARTLAVPDIIDTHGEVTEDLSWKRSLLSHTLSEHYAHSGDSRYLMRTHGDQLRGFLSDRFRRLDSRPLLESFVGACQKVGAVPVEGVANDVRVSVRAILPRVIEPVPGEPTVFGLAWTNSDYGAGTYSISAFAIRLVCLNGMVGENTMKQVHLGGRLPDDLVFSERTYRKDTETMSLATGDIVKGLLEPAAVEKKADAIRAAHARETTFDAAFRGVRNALTKAEAKSVRDAFEGQDTIMLPPGKTVWRFSNALSWVANQVEDPARKLEMQELAGKVVRPAA